MATTTFLLLLTIGATNTTRHILGACVVLRVLYLFHQHAANLEDSLGDVSLINAIGVRSWSHPHANRKQNIQKKILMIPVLHHHLLRLLVNLRENWESFTLLRGARTMSNKPLYP